MKLLVIGGSGLVGTNIVKIASETEAEVHATYHNTGTERTDSQLDKTDADQTTSLIKDLDPDVVIDTAAFHAVDDCETERGKAWAVNAAGTRNAAFATDKIGAHFIYLSTDYVFSGEPSEAPYTEEDPVSPLNYYARTKYAGEQAAQIADTATVLRPSVIYGDASSNFVTWALDELREGNELNIVDDQVSTPTYAPDLAQVCLEVADRELTGVYHAAGPESLSRYEFTVKLAEVGGFDSELISPISTEELGQEAPRPAVSSLDSTQLYDATGCTFQQPSEAFNNILTSSRNR